MKKRFLGITAVCMAALLTACSFGKVGGSGTVKNGLNTQMTADVAITIDEFTASGKVTRESEGVWVLDFNEPKTVSGVKLSFTNGEAEASYKGLSFSVPHTALPVKSMMLNLITVVEEQAKLEELEGKLKDEFFEIKGKLECGDYILTVDKDGKLVNFAMPGSKLDMKFTNVVTNGSAPTENQPSDSNPTFEEFIFDTVDADADADVSVNANVSVDVVIEGQEEDAAQPTSEDEKTLTEVKDVMAEIIPGDGDNQGDFGIGK